MRRALAALALALLLAAWRTPAARANVAEFASFDVLPVEQDDENVLDHYLVRPAEEWRSEWEGARNALRTDQGCMTAGTWYQDTELKARSDMSKRTWLDVGLLQHFDMEATWEYLQFDFMHTTNRFGTVGLRFRPAYDKSQHDFAALWQYGADDGPLRVRGAFTFEDAFNKLWEFRQAQVGNSNEPYQSHPFEPALQVTAHGAHDRLEISGKWLTPSTKDRFAPADGILGNYSLWGSRAFLLAEHDVRAWTLVARYDGVQARSAQIVAGLPGDARNYRRRWTAEFAVRRHFSPRLRAEARYLYANRAEDWHPPVAVGAFRALDRMGAAEVAWEARPDWLLRVGLLYDRIGVTRTGQTPGFTYGSRKESRAFIGLQARFGRVRVRGIEGIELDSEPYPVTFHHDKGFLALQTTF